MTTPVYLSAREAAAELGVSVPTLYAYVSRGLLRSEAAGLGRRKRYRADDVRTLVERRGGGEAANGAGPAWGGPALESEITLIADGAFYYRGRDALALASHAGLEAVAALLWNSSDSDPFAAPLPADLLPALAAELGRTATLEPIPRAISAMARLAAHDAQAFALTAPARAALGARILRLMAPALVGSALGAGPLHQAVGQAWRLDARATDLVRTALVLVADHELNASTFTVRCVASTNANLYLAVAAGLAALSGPLHGGGVARVEAMLAELDGKDPARAVARRLQRGDDLPGFGHRLYPDGDPRARLLMQRLHGGFDGDPALGHGLAVADAVRRLAGIAPNVDYALGLLARLLGRPSTAGLVLFALGRTVGWIAHALEQYRLGRLVRPRARYVGIIPGPA